MTVAAPSRSVFGRLWSLLATTVRFLWTLVIGTLLCLTAPTALIALGWLTRKTASDIARYDGKATADRTSFFLGDGASRGIAAQWFGGLMSNLAAGAKAWLGALALSLPFSLVWYAGWFAGWENSFSKGYEQAGVWPATSLLAVFLSLPILALLPMAVAHQARHITFSSIFALRDVARHVCVAGWRYPVLTLLIVLGCAGVLVARALPVFVENMLPAEIQGDSEALEALGRTFRLVMTAGLFAGVLLVRTVMARTYAHAEARLRSGAVAGRLKSFMLLATAAALWLPAVFLIYVGQFLNYSGWAWLNQPVLMLPWFGMLK